MEVSDRGTGTIANLGSPAASFFTRQTSIVGFMNTHVYNNIRPITIANGKGIPHIFLKGFIAETLHGLAEHMQVLAIVTARRNLAHFQNHVAVLHGLRDMQKISHGKFSRSMAFLPGVGK
jgi:hypothetical protein